ncbi:aspartate aminotransferase family protein [Mesorhizobium sp. M0684]|uniref:aspartate aminotransferase family protein n=1 Tax=Mesorhizobium sp. M0684 TaxID=2956986 RepID=UPI00333DA3EA
MSGWTKLPQTVTLSEEIAQLESNMSHWPNESSVSKQLYDRALEVMPGGITRNQPWQEPFPIYAARGEGAYVFDVDGTKRLDLLNNFASLVHGHAHPEVVEKVRERVGLGTAFTLPTEAEILLAETLTRRVERFEWVRFSNSGSEAVMCAIKAARALTGRPKLVKLEGAYHGSYDFAEVSLDSNPENWGNEPRSVGFSAGVPQGILNDVIVIPFNDVETAERIIRASREDIAAILIDTNPSYLGFAPISPAFAEMVRRVSRDIGALLILDEVITFRLHVGGAQSLYGIEPDLTCLAKIIGGGLPIGAVAGPRDVMKVFDHRQGKPLLPWSGTFTGNPVSTVAGSVSLELLTKEMIDHIGRLGAHLRDELSKVMEKTGFPGQVTGVGSMFKICGHQRPITDYRSAYHNPSEAKTLRLLQGQLVRESYHVSSAGLGFLSTPMSLDDIDGFIQATERAIHALEPELQG